MTIVTIRDHIKSAATLNKAEAQNLVGKINTGGCEIPMYFVERQHCVCLCRALGNVGKLLEHSNLQLPSNPREDNRMSQ